MKKRLLAAVLCAILLAALPGTVWSAAEPEPETSDPPGPHVHAEHLYYVPANRPTCMSEGNLGYYVCECGMWFSDAAATDPILDSASVFLPKAAHTPEVFPGTNPTCTEDGVSGGFRCSVCGETLEGMVPIPKLGHKPAEAWSSNAGGHWHACTVCGEQVDYAAHVSSGPATATKAETCTVCGYEIRPATGGNGQQGGNNQQGTVHPTPRPTPTPAPSPSPEPSAAPSELKRIRVSFIDAGDAPMEDLILEQPDADAAECVFRLPGQKPASAGWYFEGWRCDADGKLYQPGDELSFRYGDTQSVQLTAEWTALIGRGNYDLTAGMRYRFGEGTYQIDGDSTVYYGGSAFYVREGGNYTIR